LEALRFVGRVDAMEWVVKANIRRHDWDRQHNCIYGLRLDLNRDRGSAENLDARFLGIRRALWENWAHRPNVRQFHIQQYVYAHGTFDFFRVIMWHLLPINEWLNLWRIRRASRRG
jgi:hypothetical protein